MQFHEMKCDMKCDLKYDMIFYSETRALHQSNSNPLALAIPDTARSYVILIILNTASSYMAFPVYDAGELVPRNVGTLREIPNHQSHGYSVRLWAHSCPTENAGLCGRASQVTSQHGNKELACEKRRNPSPAVSTLRVGQTRPTGSPKTP